jgi:hypothetical protein
VPPQFTRKEEPCNESESASISPFPTIKILTHKNRHSTEAAHAFASRRTEEIRFYTAAVPQPTPLLPSVEHSTWPGGMRDAHPTQHRCIKQWPAALHFEPTRPNPLLNSEFATNSVNRNSALPGERIGDA